MVTSTGCRLVLRDVRHVPEVRLNLIATGRLDDEGYIGSFRNNTLKVCKGNLIGKGACGVHLQGALGKSQKGIQIKIEDGSDK